MVFGLINGTANVIIRFWFLNLCVCCHLCASCLGYLLEENVQMGCKLDV
jgi:hypothetical protein